jgi:hypothetical protein
MINRCQELFSLSDFGTILHVFLNTLELLAFTMAQVCEAFGETDAFCISSTIKIIFLPVYYFPKKPL